MIDIDYYRLSINYVWKKTHQRRHNAVSCFSCCSRLSLYPVFLLVHLELFSAFWTGGIRKRRQQPVAHNREATVKLKGYDWVVSNIQPTVGKQWCYHFISHRKKERKESTFSNYWMRLDMISFYSETCIKRTPSGNAVVSAWYRVSA